MRFLLRQNPIIQIPLPRLTTVATPLVRCQSPCLFPRLSISPSTREISNYKPTNGYLYTWFPLSSDNLLNLIQYNVYRALLINLVIVSPIAIRSADLLSAMNVSQQALPRYMPPTLTATTLQRRVRHPAWIDLIPLPVLRDKLILTRGTYDEDALCVDIIGGLFHSFDGPEHNGIIVWTDPWDISGWEVTEGFVRKWGFLLIGCHDVLKATNYRRQMRLEECLVIG